MEMKNPIKYLDQIRLANLSETPILLINVIMDIQKDAAMSSFQNTTEDFNMEAIQGVDEMTNSEIYRRLLA